MTRMHEISDADRIRWATFKGASREKSN